MSKDLMPDDPEWLKNKIVELELVLILLFFLIFLLIGLIIIHYE